MSNVWRFFIDFSGTMYLKSFPYLCILVKDAIEEWDDYAMGQLFNAMRNKL